MKSELEPLMSTGQSEWETPDDLFVKVSKFMKFSLDVAATKENALCRRFFTQEDDAFSKSWASKDSWWLNPPYGDGENPCKLPGCTKKRCEKRGFHNFARVPSVYDWCEEATSQQSEGHPGAMLLPARTDTRWFHAFVYRRPNIQYDFLKGRLIFTINGKPMLDKKGKPTPAPFPSMVVFFRPRW